MVTIVWDEQRTKFENERFVLTMRTGESVSFRNRITILQRQNPRLGVDIYNEILKLAEYVSKMAGASGDYPGVPEMVIYRRDRIRAAIVWGIVPSGAKKRRALIGEYRFVIVLEEELEDTLSRVFDIERLLSGS